MAEVNIKLPHKFEPRKYQYNFWRTCIPDALKPKGEGIKRALWVIHRRGGKDKTMFNALVAVAAQKMANYAYYFPTAALGQKALWGNVDVVNGMRVIDHVPPDLLAKPPNQSRMELELKNGSTIRVLGTENLDVVGGNFYGTVWSETAQQNPMAWDLTRPILAENGGFAWFNGTPRGRNWFWKLKNTAIDSPEWFCEVLSADKTGAISKEAIDKERRDGMSEDMVKQEFYCDFTIGQPGAIYAICVEDQRAAGRINRDVIYDPEFPVYTVFDIGAPANTKCWVFQLVRDRIKFLESMTGSTDCQTPNDWAKRLLNRKKYRYAGHILPHDGETLWRRLMEDAGFSDVQVLKKPLSEWDNIGKATAAFGRCDFNSELCGDGLESLENYHCKQEQDGMTIREKPVHDWASHYSTAFGYAHQAIKDGVIADKWTVNVQVDVEYSHKSSLLRPSRVGGQRVYDQVDVMN